MQDNFSPNPSFGPSPNPSPAPQPQAPAPQPVTVQTNFMTPNPGQPIPVAPAPAQAAPIQMVVNPNTTKSSGGILKIAIIFLLVATTLGASGVAFMFWQKSEENSKQIATLEQQLEEARNNDGEEAPDEKDITEKIEKFYQFLRIAQTQTPDKVMDFLQFTNYAGETSDGYVKSKLKFEKFRDSIHTMVGTDSLMLDYDIYKNFKNTDGILYYKANVDTREGFKYEDKINSLKLVDLDTLHYEATIETSQIDNSKDTSSVSAQNSHNYDIYFVRNSENQLMLDKVEQKD